MTTPATVLVIDDEATVRRVACRFFERIGWTALGAADGEAGLRIVGAGEPPLDLVVTDLQMPRITGEEVVAVLGEYRPGLPVICMTGYAPSPEIGTTLAARDIPLFRKPFVFEELVDAARQEVARAAARRGAEQPPAVHDLVAVALARRQRPG